MALRIKHAERHDSPLRGKCINLVQITYNMKKVISASHSAQP